MDVAVDGVDVWVLNFHPDSPERNLLDPYRHRLRELGMMVGRIELDA